MAHDRRSFLYSLIFLAALVFLNPGMKVVAQTEVVPDTHKIAGIQTRMMIRRLNLSPEQVARVRSINEFYLKQITDLLDNRNLPPDQKLRRLRQIRQNKRQDLEGVLTVDQFREYLVLQEEMKARRMQRIQGGGPGADPY